MNGNECAIESKQVPRRTMHVGFMISAIKCGLRSEGIAQSFILVRAMFSSRPCVER